ncbi:MAG TPA: hypothetical protein VEA19_06235 [Actinomycetota bacterium]|nr:hypothetical protein [Actinomycetota bacterium]
MDRYEELDAKRQGEGLTEDEANELGRLEAERAGRPYEGNADDPPLEVRAERVGADPEEATEEEVAATEEKDVDDTVLTDERRRANERDNPPVA